MNVMQYDQSDELINDGAILLPDGTEVPITEAMVQHSLNQLMDDSFFPSLYQQPAVAKPLS